MPVTPPTARAEDRPQLVAAARATDDCRRGIATFLETKKPPKWR